MQTNNTGISTFYVSHLQRILEENKVSLASYLNVDNHELANYFKADGVMSCETFDTLVSNLVRSSGVASPGLLLGKALHAIHHGPFGLAIMNAPTVLDVVYLVQRFIAMRAPGLTLFVYEKEHEIVVTVHDDQWSGHTHQFLIDALTGAFLNLHNSLVTMGNQPVIQTLLFDYDASERHSHELFTGCPERLYNAHQSGIVLNKEASQTPLMGTDSVSYSYAVSLCEQERKRSVTDSYVEKLALYFKQCNEALPTLSDAALFLCMSKRTLHRKLQLEHTSFIKQRDRFLMKRAIDLLTVKKQTVKEVAYLLGYNDQANFRRAFVSWYGCAPSQYIKKTRDTNDQRCWLTD